MKPRTEGTVPVPPPREPIECWGGGIDLMLDDEGSRSHQSRQALPLPQRLAALADPALPCGSWKQGFRGTECS